MVQFVYDKMKQSPLPPGPKIFVFTLTEQNPNAPLTIRQQYGFASLIETSAAVRPSTVDWLYVIEVLNIFAILCNAGNRDNIEARKTAIIGQRLDISQVRIILE